MFMGTPHQGGEGVAWGKRLVDVASIFVKTNNKLLKILKRDSEILQQQLAHYNSISSDFETKFAFETKATPLALGKAMIVVPKSSAVVPGQVDAEPVAIMDHHINMVKFEEQSNEFKRVAGHLKLMVDKAPTKVQKNWLTERGIETVSEAPDDVPFGLDVWVEGVDPIVDIVAIHGLNGHREKTWTTKSKLNWLRDANMLSAIIPNARIMSWGYDANTHSTKGLSAMYLYDYAQNLVRSMPA
jgi:hypothetical protein